MEKKLSNNILDMFSFLKNMAGIKLFFMFSKRYILSLKIHWQPKHQLHHFNFFKQQTDISSNAFCKSLRSVPLNVFM